MQHRDIAFIGAGNMSRSIISGMCASGYPSQKITASNPSLPKLDALKNDFSICITQQNAQAVAQAQVVVLAVKPQLMEQMCSELTKSCDITGKLFISIAAGIPIQRLSEMLAGHTNIIRTMPNTPSSLGKGMTGLYAPSHVAQSDKDYAGQLLSMVGEITWVETENLMNGVTAAAGSSPAYFYTFLEAMQKEAEQQGFDHQTARLLVQQAMLGAAEMVCHNPDLEISELRAQVMSKAGTTAQAVEHLQNNGIDKLVSGAMRAAVTRAEEMAKLF
jgi:pyrroline-5-carboxylate reductase